MSSILAIEGSPRDYAWGSRSAIQALLGQPPTAPLAELWFGSHAQGPSFVPALGRTLDAVISTDPAGFLGSSTVTRLGEQLPYLLNVLAADMALSIQVHPTRAQARDGFAREDAAGIARDAPNRNYRDPNHKPELMCALTPFDALCGFRPVDDTLALLASLDVPELGFVNDLLTGPDPLRAAFTALLSLQDPGPVVAALAGRVAGAQDGPLYAVRLASEDAPGDVGVLVALLLNYVRLEPGEAIYLGAGTVHAYLRGMGVEIMANSDNVLRCGLTPKHVDVPELLRITEFAALDVPRWPSVGGRFDVPVPDFSLTRLEIDEPTGLHDTGPCIVLCTAGAVTVGEVPVPSGHAAFVPAATPARIGGSGVVFVASVGR